METLSNKEMQEIEEMAFHLYATSEDVPECPLDQDVLMEQAIDIATDFAQRWQEAGLPKKRMLKSFCNEYIRAYILMNVHQQMKFPNKILDQLDQSWNTRERFSRQRQILRQAEEKYQQDKYAQCGEQQ